MTLRQFRVLGGITGCCHIWILGYGELVRPLYKLTTETQQAQTNKVVWSPETPGDFPDPGIEPRSPTLQADSLPAEPQGKPENTGVGSLSLLQQIFPLPGIKPGSPALQVDSLPTELSGKAKVVIILP